jgi:hypothetical protein
MLPSAFLAAQTEAPLDALSRKITGKGKTRNLLGSATMTFERQWRQRRREDILLGGDGDNANARFGAAKVSASSDTADYSLIAPRSRQSEQAGTFVRRPAVNRAQWRKRRRRGRPSAG